MEENILYRFCLRRTIDTLPPSALIPFVLRPLLTIAVDQGNLEESLDDT